MMTRSVITPQILFEDTHLMVLSKPAGLLSQSDISGEKSLVDWLREYLGRNYVGLIHRLDRNTSGAMVIAKRTKAARRLTESLQEGKLERTYLAFINGNLKVDESWRDWLCKDKRKNEVSVVAHKENGTQEAYLHVKPVICGKLSGQTVTLASFFLETGRSHQIRIQAAHRDHALIGDEKYGGVSHPVIQRPALHSWKIVFPHPMSQDKLAFEAPFPDDFENLKKMLK